MGTRWGQDGDRKGDRMGTGKGDSRLTHCEQRVTRERVHGRRRECRPEPPRPRGGQENDENGPELYPKQGLDQEHEGGGFFDALDSPEGGGAEQPHDEEGGDGPGGA